MRRFFVRGALAVALVVAAAGCVVVEDPGPSRTRSQPPPAPVLLDVYEPCGSSADCGGLSDACYEITVDHGSHVVTDGMCTLGCLDDFDCPYGGACYSVQGMDYLCYQRCDFDSDCPPGFACIDTIGANDAICLPF